MAATKGSEQEVTRFNFNFNRVNRSGVELRSDNSGLRAGGGRPVRAYCRSPDRAGGRGRGGEKWSDSG